MEARHQVRYADSPLLIRTIGDNTHTILAFACKVQRRL